jgi:nucleotidyltransferase substrate binding protein (TIGR01987 family)
MAKDIRWIQRYNNFQKAINSLKKAVSLSKERNLNELEKQGLIKAFEFTFELSWNVIKDYFEYQGETEIFGSRDAFRLAFNRGIIINGEIWMDMIKSRVLTSHTYNENLADEIYANIINNYFSEFIAFEKKE